ncbi:MAG: type II toxin-antitoxin system prevent-host-death family antitoxin [Deltaproteobacteria bacterium]|nr:type II toxin-antitoxin system prevent-host-death family antitoxin [Deltaproteobacteria bacterium]MBW2042494.1 type II toxin-antitoxin system prevent-host-death family antitoxin [Deltaproteobacteria bacterium]MBW2133132.1 type II toxin-antitoxin system prevent-host-death family antitoxin [Deltaproteobacteria bacterium]
MIPRQVGIREAKIQLSKLMKWVKNGQEIILTDRGRPVGKIVPMDKEALPLADRIRHLEEQGVLVPIEGKSKRSLPVPIPLSNELAQKILQEDRNDAR